MLKKFVIPAAALVSASALFLAAPAMAATEAADQTQTISANILGNGFYCTSATPSPTDEVEEGNAFTAGASGNLTSFDLPIHFTSTPGDMVASLYNVSGGVPTGAALATQTIPAATVAAISHATLHVTFAHPGRVTSGHTYAFTMKFAACGGGLQQIDYMIGDAPADKQIVTYVNGAWTTQSLRGISFTTYVTPVVATKSASASPSLSNTGASPLTPMIIAAGAGLLGLGAVVVAFAQIAAVTRRSKDS